MQEQRLQRVQRCLGDGPIQSTCVYQLEGLSRGMCLRILFAACWLLWSLRQWWLTHQIPIFFARDRSRSAKLQNNACNALNKISSLPCHEYHRTLFTHSVAHSKWLCGVECQFPNKSASDKIRAAVVKVLSKGLKKNRSPHLILATGHDPFVDPEAAAFKPVLSRLRTLAFKDPAAAARLVQKAKYVRITRSTNPNGAACVLAFVINKLGWSFSEGEDEAMTFSPPGVILFDFLSGSKKHVQEELARSVRTMLMAQAHERRDWFSDFETPVYIAKTRLLEDMSMTQDLDRLLAHEAIYRDQLLLQPTFRAAVQRLSFCPVWASLRNVLKSLLWSQRCGSVRAM